MNLKNARFTLLCVVGLTLFPQPGVTCMPVFSLHPCHDAKRLAQEITRASGGLEEERNRLHELLLHQIEEYGPESLLDYANCILNSFEPLDLGDAEDVLMQSTDHNEMAALLDINQLQLENGETQFTVLEAALRNGKEAMWRGSVLSRHDAYLLAARSGIPDLRTTSMEMCEIDPPEWPSCAFLGHLQDLFPVSGDYPTRAEAMINRLLEFDPVELDSIYTNDAEFRAALEYAVEGLCPPHRPRTSSYCYGLRHAICTAADAVYDPHPWRGPIPLSNRGWLDWLVDNKLSEPCSIGACRSTFGPRPPEPQTAE